MKTLTLLFVLSVLSTNAFALPSRAPAPVLGEAVDSTRQPAQI